MHKKNQRTLIRVQYDFIVQLQKKAGFLKSAAGFARFFALRQPVLMTVRRGVF